MVLRHQENCTKTTRLNFAFTVYPRHLCHRALSVPLTKQSRRPDPQEATAGSEVRPPPSLSQPYQEPSYHLCHRALSVPLTKQSMRLGPQDTVAGPEVRLPPRLSQPCQEPSYHLCH